MADDIIRATNVDKIYEMGDLKVVALRKVSLMIPRGEMVAIMGPSGSGKTTLLNTFSGIDDINNGQVLIDGYSIHEMSDRERTRYRALNMGFVFQAYNLLPVLSAAENVELPLLLAGVRSGQVRARAEEVLEQVGLADQRNKLPAAMSGGQQQRVTVARALASRPAIVWADEPTGALDSETGSEVMDLLVTLNRQLRQTFVLITHDPVVGSRAGRLIHMRDGAIESDELQGAGATSLQDRTNPDG